MRDTLIFIMCLSPFALMVLAGLLKEHEATKPEE